MQHKGLTGDIEWHERPGKGAVLVCLHGIGSLATTFTPLTQYLPSDVRVIAWNAPGYGQSRPLDSDWPVAAEYADALCAFIDALKLDHVHILGHSLGTLMGASFAARYPERVASLTLASCAQGRGTPKGGTLCERDALRLSDLTRLGAQKFAQARAPRLVFMPERNAELVDAVQADMAKVTMPGYGQAVRMLASGNLSADCARVKARTTVIVGDQDLVTPPDQSRAAYKALDPQARGAFILAPNTGHALHRQAVTVLANALASNIGDVVPDTGILQPEKTHE